MLDVLDHTEWTFGMNPKEGYFWRKMEEIF